MFLFLFLFLQINIFIKENEEIEKFRNNSLFVKWDSLNFYLKYEGKEDIALFIGNGFYGIKNIKLENEYVFVKPIHLIIYSDGKKFLIKDSILIPLLTDSILVKDNFFKIPKNFFPETTVYIYFSVRVKKSDSIFYFPEKREYQTIIPLYKLLVDANVDGKWDMDIIPKGVIEKIYPPEEFYILKMRMSKTIIRKGEYAYFIVSPYEDGFVSASIFNEMGQKICDLEKAKWMQKDNDYLIEWKPEFDILKPGKYFCIFYLNNCPVLKVPVFLVR